MSFVLRWLFAFILLAATYNPTQLNFVRWAEANWAEQMPLVVLAALILLVGYVIYLRATLRSIGAFGMLLVLALVGAILWVLWDFGLVSLDNPGLATWIGILALSIVLGVGLSWSIIRRRLSGQVDMDDVEE
ncbi:DUF6524 family protein [Ponticoccus alexandrii]|uniref:Uncharacterized protein n=1 Tax=Ponticoccus alexandrii TaxID=1943633 RepID=A0ABX7FC10_9RHOB|nr:DUF6524 family protein [Ponticoccus alexandrii]ETA51933.1 hypothetical protein P279_11365 [Rhodobacteraceae bacterium PD-2]QRF68105.1 hypothetical protein GQA70_18385 [Ponticoccus alexandrii]